MVSGPSPRKRPSRTQAAEALAKPRHRRWEPAAGHRSRCVLREPAEHYWALLDAVGLTMAPLERQ